MIAPTYVPAHVKPDDVEVLALLGSGHAANVISRMNASVPPGWALGVKVPAGDEVASQQPIPMSTGRNP